MSSLGIYAGAHVALWGPGGQGGKGGWVQMRPNGKLSYLSDPDATKDKLEPWRTWERFLVVDTGSGTVGLYHEEHKYFVTVKQTEERRRVSAVSEAASPYNSFIPVLVETTGQILHSFQNSRMQTFLYVDGEMLFEVHCHPSPLFIGHSFGNIPEHLIDEIRAGNVIAFLGAGFSAAAGI